MKKKKILAILLTASLLSSVTGCSNKKKEVIETATEYAEAVISGDIDDIADFLEDGDDLEEFMEAYEVNSRRQDIVDAIYDSMSFEIDEKSVKIKDSKATVDVTYTLVDYMCVYEDLDDEDGLEEYLDELEGEDEETITIDQTIELEQDDGEWIVIDDDFENMEDFLSFYEDITELSWGSSGTVSQEEFNTTLEEVFGIDSMDYSSSTGSSYAITSYFGDDYWIEYFYYAEEESITELFQCYQDAYDSLNGTVLYDGEDNITILFNGSDHYGGIYLRGNSMMIIMTYDRSSSEIDDMLDMLGLTKP